MIARGRAELDAEVAKLPESEQAVGQEVAQGVQTKFADLEKSVEEKQTQLVDALAQKYVQAQKDVDSVINTLKDPVGAIIQVAKDAIGGVIDTILKMRQLLLGLLAKAGEAIELIIADPIGFLGNLVTGVKQGVKNFASNIATHLQKGLFAWLFGTLAQAGIQIPEKFDLSGILSIVLQVLGLTYANFRRRAVAIVGEKVVSALETASEIFVNLVTKGPASLWEYIKEKASQLIQSVLDGIKSFLIEKVIMAGITWIIGLLNPASAFVKACKAIYDIVMFFIERGQQILELVNAVLDSILSIARGAIGVAANAVEKALAKAVPVAIGFLAALLGLSGLSEKIKAVIDKIQAPINDAIDWVIKKAVQLVKAAGRMLGIGKEKKSEKEDDPQAALVKQKALDDVQQQLTAKPVSKFGELRSVFSQVKSKYRSEGLKGLSAKFTTGANGTVELVATASPTNQRVVSLSQIIVPKKQGLPTSKELEEAFSKQGRRTFASVAVNGESRCTAS